MNFQIFIICSVIFLHKSASGNVHVVVVRGYKESCSYGMKKIRAAYTEYNIQWSQKLANGAEQVALNNAIHGFGHSGTTRYGENLFEQGFNNDKDLRDHLHCDWPLWQWFKEKNEKGGFKGKEHFMQMVAEKDTSFGIGAAYNTWTKRLYFVGWFDPNIHKDEKTWKYLKGKKQKGFEVRSRLDLSSGAGTPEYCCRNINGKPVPCWSNKRITC